MIEDIEDGIDEQDEAYEDVFIDGVRQLRPEYHKVGMNQRVIWRNNDLALAEVTSKLRGSTGKGYEVWKIQRGVEREIAGVKVPASEFPPSSCAWGRQGWSFVKLENAIEQLKILDPEIQLPKTLLSE